jgi:hypothetical protein
MALLDTIPDSHVDANYSRQMAHGYEILMQWQREDRLREYVVIALGTNGNVNAQDMIEKIIDGLDPGHRLIFVTPYDGRGNPAWMSWVTAEYMRPLPDRYPFVTVADWADLIHPYRHLLQSDYVHMNGRETAINLYTTLIVESIFLASQKPPK